MTPREKQAFREFHNAAMAFIGALLAERISGKTLEYEARSALEKRAIDALASYQTATASSALEEVYGAE